MAEMRDLLLEIGTEELPPKALRPLMQAFEREVLAGLRSHGLEPAASRSYATPRRLAVSLEALAVTQPQQTVERRGPALQAAYDTDGKPTRAAEGFARSCGVPVDALETLRTDKGEWLAYRAVQEGRTTASLVPEVVDQALSRLPIPRRMRWGSSAAAFVRPVHWAVALFGSEVIDMTVLGVRSGGKTRGHRFHAPEAVAVRDPAGYADQLEREAYVIVDFDRRRDRIRAMAEGVAAELGGRAVIDEALLEEVTALVEWPVAIAGSFDERFLEVPAEALVSSMQTHQKYFPVRTTDGRLMPRFIAIANLESQDPAQVVAGNERVIRPRLADAEFFWNQDRRRPLEDRIAGLRDIVFQKRLGSLHDKAVRVAALARLLAPSFHVEAAVAERAAMLGKCDLLTEMVGEFPELQGIMGRYYAAHDGLTDGIPESLEEQYRPRFAGDTLPATPLGQLLAVAERADTLAGIFALGQAPSGDKDPFALRRAALGLVRILTEGEHRLSLRRLLDHAVRHLPQDLQSAAVTGEVFDFCMERLKGYYQERGYTTELFDAVRGARVRDADGNAVPVDDLVDLRQRLEACATFQELEAAASLSAANKRVQNILRKAEWSGDGPGTDPAKFENNEEKQLHEIIGPLADEVHELAEAGCYTEALERMATVREPVDAFFDHVMVMADDPAVRDNRLALLAQLSRLLGSVADIARLPGRQS